MELDGESFYRHIFGDEEVDRAKMAHTAQTDQLTAREMSPFGLSCEYLLGYFSQTREVESQQDAMLLGFHVALLLNAIDPDLWHRLCTDAIEQNGDVPENSTVRRVRRALRRLLGMGDALS